MTDINKAGCFDTSLILQHIAMHVTLDDDEKKLFVGLLKTKAIKRKRFLLREGEICRYSTFVNKGCLRGFTYDRNGFEHVLTFAPPGWWIGDMYSIITQKPGTLNIEALEDSELLLLSKPDQELICQKVPKLEHFFRIIIENSLVSSHQRLMESVSLSTEERYLNFCRKYPMLVKTLPQKQIASYLGVTPEFFSKMKRELLKKQ